VLLAWASGVVGSAEKPAGGAAGGGCEDEPRDHADAEGQDEQGGDHADSGRQCSHEDGEARGEYGDEKNSGHRALDVPAKKERETYCRRPRTRSLIASLDHSRDTARKHCGGDVAGTSTWMDVGPRSRRARRSSGSRAARGL
jgi:hypothetical protein